MRELSLNVKDVKEIAEKLDFKIILDGGSLLGAYRDNGPIKNDEDDIDFAVPFEVMQFKALDIVKEFQARGFELYRLRDTVMTFKRNGSKIDFLFYKEDEFYIRSLDHTEINNTKSEGYFYYLTLYHNKKPFALKVPCEYWNNLGTIEFLGEKFLCPEKIEHYLVWRFGDDWRTPILRPAFGFKNYLENKKLTTFL